MHIKSVYENTISLFKYNRRLSSVVPSRQGREVAFAKFEVFSALLFRWLAALKTSNPLTNGTFRKTIMLNVGTAINIFNT